MAIVFLAIVYLLIAGAVIFTGRVICEEYDLLEIFDGSFYVAIGIFWPVTLIPFVCYIASSYYLHHRTKPGGSK